MKCTVLYLPFYESEMCNLRYGEEGLRRTDACRCNFNWQSAALVMRRLGVRVPPPAPDVVDRQRKVGLDEGSIPSRSTQDQTTWACPVLTANEYNVRRYLTRQNKRQRLLFPHSCLITDSVARLLDTSEPNQKCSRSVRITG